MDSDIFGSAPVSTRDVKWNIFRFQDHLLEWISYSAQLFQMQRYQESFMALIQVYIDSYGFFSNDEMKEIDNLYKETLNKTNEFVEANRNYLSLQNQNRRNKSGVVNLPDIYTALVDFRKKLMVMMSRHQLLIPIIDKSGGGAGNQ